MHRLLGLLLILVPSAASAAEAIPPDPVVVSRHHDLQLTALTGVGKDAQEGVVTFGLQGLYRRGLFTAGVAGEYGSAVVMPYRYLGGAALAGVSLPTPRWLRLDLLGSLGAHRYENAGAVLGFLGPFEPATLASAGARAMASLAQLNGHLSPAEMVAYGWRIPFLVGGGFGLVAVWLRRWLSETPVFAEMRANKALARELPLKSVLRGHRTAVVLSMLATWTITAGIVVVILMTPTLVQDRFHVPAARAFLGNTLAATTLSIGCVLFGLAADRFGRGRALLVGAALLVASTYALYADLQAGAGAFLVLYPLAGLCVGVTGVVPSIMVGLFPPAVRFSGISFAYNVSYAFFGAITAPLVGYLARSWGGALAPAHYVAAAALAGAGVALHQLRAKPAS